MTCSFYIQVHCMNKHGTNDNFHWNVKGLTSNWVCASNWHLKAYRTEHVMETP